ncbi:MAG: hypothetical protein AB7S26_33580 [Sandaracinaceae bacterium]
MKRLALALACGPLLGLAPSVASAQEDGDLRLMAEPFSYVDVADAFDDDDPFDLNVRVGYRNVYQFGNIQRDGSAGATDPNRQTRNWQDIAHHQHTQNLLDLGLDVGIFRDLMIFGRMPIILSDDRSLGRVAGMNPANLDALNVDDTVDADGDGVDDLMPGRTPPPLFGVPFNSPTRSGLDYIEAGLAWSIFNQNRERELPTWVLMVSGRFNVGDPMVACNGTSGTSCRNWSFNETTNRWSFADGGTDAGETRGTNGLRIETRASWRTRYVEPYGGLLFAIEWPGTSERFFLPAGNIQGFINSQPPIIGQLTGGMAIIPWEDRAGWQRFAIDVRFSGQYVSEGHGYSPLFDALGTSQNRYLTEQNCETAQCSGTARSVPFFGLTDVQQHAELGARLGLEMRAARFVTFQLSGSLTYLSPYIITYADACNPNVDRSGAMDPRAGTCRRGIINPHHRSVIDLPGQQFRLDEQIRSELSFRVIGMF